ncbi:MAG: hypothetical protein J3R72DRAFT_430946 [Linnemannia gamsii]|nr:MAG: hypothetical protein J3R72DRAFT_430946 [Linnemannia gamsii]
MRIKTISPTKAAILACATIGAISLISTTDAFSVNFVYNDLLAHPQYNVLFHQKEVVPASSVSSLRNTHRRQPTQRQAQIETTKTEGQGWEQETIHESPSTVVMKDTDGMRWSCMIPPKLVHEVKTAPTLTPQEMKEEENRSIHRGLELLDHLSAVCLQMTPDYWTYEYCHKKWIRQYHAVPANNGQMVPENEDNTYVLALYQPETSSAQDKPVSNEAALEQQSPSSPVSSTITTTKLKISNDRRYLAQQWEHGDICKPTKKPRMVEVQFQCGPLGDMIQLVTEHATCTYTMVISSPSLCRDPAFESAPAPEVNQIQCRRIVSDEQYQILKAASTHHEAIDGSDPGAGIVQDHKAQINIGQVPPNQPTHNQKKQQKQDSTVDPQAALLKNLEEIFQYANKHINDIDSRKKLDDVFAQYKAFVQVFKPMVTPDIRAEYERLEDLIQNLVGGDKRAMLSDKEPEWDTAKAKAAFDALFGGAEETEKQPKADEPAKEPTKQQQSFNIHTQDSSAQLTKEDEELFEMVIQALAKSDKKQEGTIDLASWLNILDAVESAGMTDEAAKKQGQGQEQEATEEKKEAQAKL